MSFLEQLKARRAKINQAAEIYEDTNLTPALQAVAASVDGRINTGDNISSNGKEHVSVEIAWEDNRIGRIKRALLGTSTSFVHVECDTDGTLKVRGGLLTSTTIPEQIWRAQPEVFEGALKRAFDRPSQFHRLSTSHRASHHVEGPSLAGIFEKIRGFNIRHRPPH